LIVPYYGFPKAVNEIDFLPFFRLQGKNSSRRFIDRRRLEE
jgi:hypothetical protein